MRHTNQRVLLNFMLFMKKAIDIFESHTREKVDIEIEKLGNHLSKTNEEIIKREAECRGCIKMDFENSGKYGCWDKGNYKCDMNLPSVKVQINTKKRSIAIF